MITVKTKQRAEGDTVLEMDGRWHYTFIIDINRIRSSSQQVYHCPVASQNDGSFFTSFAAGQENDVSPFP
jgi:hypothetical protein